MTSSSRATGHPPGTQDEPRVRVVLFSGGRGSQVLSEALINHPKVDLTLVVNGYDDGLSTGEIRKFLGDSLGPSDFRKNAARAAAELGSCPPALAELLELRLPEGTSAETGLACLSILQGRPDSPSDAFQERLANLISGLDSDIRTTFASKILRFERAVEGRSFPFSDCSVGNIVFAGCFLDSARSFNRALEHYCRLMGLPDGLLENVTDGTDAYLVALDVEGRVLASEADIVDATKRNHIEDIFLIDHRLTKDERQTLASVDRDGVITFFGKHAVSLQPNPRVLEKIRLADLIVYSPGTQHSSLFPSYMTPGLGESIERNLKAIKLLITNLQEDADIADSSAVEIIARAGYYLRQKNERSTPTPCLITHFLINDPAGDRDSYVPLGRLDSLRDPRLVQIANYEDPVSGRHDALKVLAPFIEVLARRRETPRIAVFLLDADSLDKIGQTMIEMVRANIEELPVTVEVFYQAASAFYRSFADSLPFAIRNLGPDTSSNSFSDVLRQEPSDYVVLFESSGMYKGADIVNLLQPLNLGRLDAIWGSRRLSINDIHMAYRLLHRKTPVRGAISYFGSHMLSLAFLGLYGRYISDTLSGARVVRTPYLKENELDPTEVGINFKLLSALLRDRAEVFETPVHYFPISPSKVRRTTMREGLSAVATIVTHRFRKIRYQSRARTTIPRPFLDANNAGNAEARTLER